MLNAKLPSLLLIVALVAGSAQAATVLQVNLGPAGLPAETGFTDWTTADKSTPSALPINGMTLSLSGVVSDVAPNIRSIDRGGNDGYTGTLTNLTRTWWGARAGSTAAGGSITIGIDGLPAGDYKFTSWHHDHEDQTGTMKIEVSTDGGTVFTEVVSEFDIIDGNTDLHAGAPNKQSFTFTANGTDSVQVRFTNVTAGTSSTSFVVVNGFQVSTSTISLSNDTIATNTPPGSLVGYLSTSLSGADAFALDVTATGPDSDDLQITGGTNLRSKVWMDSASKDITVVAYSNLTAIASNDFTITVTSDATYSAFKVGAEVGAGVATGGERVGILDALGGDGTGFTYAITGGRDDLFEITSASNLTQVAATDAGTAGDVHWLEIQAANATATNHLLVEVEVVSGTASGTMVIIH